MPDVARRSCHDSGDDSADDSGDDSADDSAGAEASDRVPQPDPRNIAMSVFTELPDDLVVALAGQGITEPTPVQAAVVPDALAGCDVLGRARTGSGKTLAFG